MQRSRSKNSANKGDVTRIWSEELFDELLRSFKSAFPHRRVISFSDRNATLMKCLTCQIELFSRTTVLVGMHGAGLSNMMFMPPQSTVVEITAQSDGRMLAGSGNPLPILLYSNLVTILALLGPFSRLAMATGINHYVHYIEEGAKSFSKRGIDFNVSRAVHSISGALMLMKSI